MVVIGFTDADINYSKLRKGVPDWTTDITLKSGRCLTIGDFSYWKDEDYDAAHAIARQCCKTWGLKYEDDMGYALESTSPAMGLQLINNSPRAEAYTGAICKTTSGEWVLWLDGEDK